MTYVIWNIDFQGYRPRDLDSKHGGIFAAMRFETKQEAAQSLRPHDVIHVIGKDGIPASSVGSEHVPYSTH